MMHRDAYKSARRMRYYMRLNLEDCEFSGAIAGEKARCFKSSTGYGEPQICD